VNHIIALSGGKDSTAMALRLAETEPRDYVFVCTPTGNEPPALLAHWHRLEAMLGKPLLYIRDPKGLEGWIRHYRSLPNWRQRWCTRILKLEPYFDWLEAQAPAVSYVGLRADEPTRDGFDLGIPGIATDYPLRRWGWGLGEVWRYLADRGIAIPKRTDCQLCFYQRLIEWWELWREQPDAYAAGEEFEAFTGQTFRSPSRDTWPAALRDLRAEFEKGRVPLDTRERQGMCRACSL
jgi:hypothetical protein